MLELWVCRINVSGGQLVMASSSERVTLYFFSAGCHGSVELDMKIVNGVERLRAHFFSFSTDWIYNLLALILTSTNFPHSRPCVNQ